MTARLSYDAKTAMGKQLADSTNALLRSRDQFQRLRDQMHQSSYPDDWAALATEIGCPPDHAQAVFSLVDGVNPALDVPPINDLSKIDQG